MFTLALPVWSSTIAVNTVMTPSPIFEPGQELTYGGPSTNASLSQSFVIGAIQDESNLTTAVTTGLTLKLNDTTDGNSPVFNVTFTPPGGGLGGTFTFTGTGAPIMIGGLTYATITEGVFTYGVQESVSINAGKGTLLNGIITSSVPEPTTWILTALGLILMIAGLWRRAAAETD